MNWKPEVLVNAQWSRNALVFATREEAEASARDLMGRWLLVEDWRAVETEDPVNCKINLDTGLVEFFNDPSSHAIET